MGRPKLRREQVATIRARYKEGNCTQGELARHYGVTITTIGRIVRNELHLDRTEEVRPLDRVIEEVKSRMAADRAREDRKLRELEEMAETDEEKQRIARYTGG